MVETIAKKEQSVLTASVHSITQELVDKYHTEIITQRIKDGKKPTIPRSRIIEELILLGLQKQRPIYFKGENEKVFKGILVGE